MMLALFDIIAGVIIILGACFTFAAAIGIIRLPDIYSRMHAASKAGSVGSGLMMFALALVATDFTTSIRAIAGIVFFLLTAPLSAHLLAKAAYQIGYKLWDKSVLDEMEKSPLDP